MLAFSERIWSEVIMDRNRCVKTKYYVEHRRYGEPNWRIRIILVVHLNWSAPADYCKSYRKSTLTHTKDTFRFYQCVMISDDRWYFGWIMMASQDTSLLDASASTCWIMCFVLIVHRSMLYEWIGHHISASVASTKKVKIYENTSNIWLNFDGNIAFCSISVDSNEFA